jgi:putative redox protein
MRADTDLPDNRLLHPGGVKKGDSMDAKVVWKKRMSFEGTSDSGFTVPLGTVPAVGGDDDGFRPLELLAIGLAGCTAMDVISILRKKKQDVHDFEVLVHADRAEEHPKVFTHITIEYLVTGKDINRAAVERAVELSESRYCPAQAMFKQITPMDLKITIKEIE